MKASNFIGKTSFGRLRLVTVDGSHVLRRHQSLAEIVAERCGEDVADIFATPVISPAKGGRTGSVAWYSVGGGDPVPLASLEGDARRHAEAELRGRLERLAPLLDDPAHAPLVGAALHVASVDDIVVVGGQPVIVNWGALPAQIAPDDDAARSAHFDATLGRYAGFGAPPIGPGRAPAELAPPARSPPARSPLQAAPAPAATGGGAPPTVPPHVVVQQGEPRPWLPVLVAVVVAALVLAYLLLPGVLIYPPRAVVPERATDGLELEIARETNRALEERVAQIRAALDGGDACWDDGSLQLGPATRASAEPGAGPPDSAAERAAALVPPDPGTLQVPPEVQPGESPFEGTLLDLLDRATVLVINVSSGGTGSGFFVAPGRVVTNSHVARDRGSQLFVVNPPLGGVRPARVAAVTALLDQGGPDLALLEIDDAAEVPYLALVPRIERLEHVVAAGFPGLFMELEEGFQRLRQGDRSAIPGLVVLTGTVTANQRHPGGIPIVAHSAETSPGSSGGPLVDACGRVAGVNTFGFEQERYIARYAVGSDPLIRFLRDSGVEPAVSEHACRPGGTVAAEAAEDEPPAEPE